MSQPPATKPALYITRLHYQDCIQKEFGYAAEIGVEMGDALRQLTDIANKHFPDANAIVAFEIKPYLEFFIAQGQIVSLSDDYPGHRPKMK
jgi:hypothetical protein